MKLSKQLMDKAGVLPKLRLAIKQDGGGVKGTGAHKVTVLEEKIFKGTDRDGKEIDMIRYIVEEEGTKKSYEVPIKDKQGELHYLVQRLSEIPEGSTIILEYKRSGAKGYIEVTLAESVAEKNPNSFTREEVSEDIIEEEAEDIGF